MDRMMRFYMKSGLFLLFALFCILFGISLASNGIERVNGPLDEQQIQEKLAMQAQKEQELKAKAEAELQKAQQKQVSYEQLRHNRTESHSLFASLGAGIGSMLKGIAKLVVSFFSSLFDLFV